MVDDEPLVRKVVTRYLISEGYHAQEAANGAEAADIFRETAFDLVITDWAMPEMNGSQLARSIKQSSPDTPVILMTGVDSGLREIDAFDEIIDLVLRKPLTRAKLRQALSDVLGSRTAMPRPPSPD